MEVVKKRNLKDLEDPLRQLPQAELGYTHHFSDGVYGRERFAPQGTLIIGKRHRYKTLTILLKGELSVYTDNDDKVKNLIAPCVFVSDANTKKMTYSHTDTVLMTVHPTEETDLDKIEEEFIMPEIEYEEKLKIGDSL